MTPNGIVIIPPQRTKAPPIVVRRIAGHLAKDRLTVLPTETRYALCAVATSRRALEEVRRVKGRSESQPFSIFIDSISRLAEWKIHTTPAAERLLQAFWPGPLTLILPTTNPIFRWLGTIESVGVRFSPQTLISQTVAKLGAPLVATSANPSGVVLDNRAENRWLTELAARGQVLWARPNRYHRRPVSTVVDCTGRRIRILRPGGIPESQLRTALGRLTS
ncbi:MAG: L-threonylcarbamoyladenylate synthase [Candidatus Zixiibacteriota bacterium]